ncbi:hypothetical protein [Tunicatimonas pelagia]|uniref:hypothetical protein n=1 Tax=Tunicatimonas pelagia TaxID=931531 RepID=UPI0026657F4D|nr:hypothetical protein [Tunicatimonas pelagia]WKN41433.1 hypothetical protein P0M28_20565 [Tunicatimonas pelagia]
MVTIDKLNTVTLACMLLIEDRELAQHQEVTIVATKVLRNEHLRKKYFASVKEWIPTSGYISFQEIGTAAPPDN